MIQVFDGDGVEPSDRVRRPQWRASAALQAEALVGDHDHLGHVTECALNTLRSDQYLTIDDIQSIERILESEAMAIDDRRRHLIATSENVSQGHINRLEMDAGRLKLLKHHLSMVNPWLSL